MAAGRYREQDGDPDDDQVVGHRRPGGSREPFLGVEDRAEQRGDPVEEDLRQQQVGELGGQVLFLAGLVARQVQPGQQWRGEHRQPGGDHQPDGRGGDEPIGVALTAVRIGASPGQEGDRHRGEHAAEQEFEHDVGQRVRHDVGVVDQREADHRHQGQLGQEAGGPGHDRGDRHRGAGADQPGRPGGPHRLVRAGNRCAGNRCAGGGRCSGGPGARPRDRPAGSSRGLGEGDSLLGDGRGDAGQHDRGVVAERVGGAR